jgi:hypothetical protein
MLDNPNQAKIKAGDGNSRSDDDRKWRRAEVFFAAVIAAATIVQAGTSWYQWKATQGQYDVMIEQLHVMERDQQSWVSVVPPKLKGKQDASEGLKFTYAFRNMGRNPVIVCMKSFGAKVIKSGADSGSVYGDLTINVGEDGHLIGEPVLKLQTRLITDNMHAFGEQTDCSIAIDPGATMDIERTWKPETALAPDEFPVFMVSANYRDISGGWHVARGGFVYIPSERRFLRDPKGDGLW